MVLSSPTCGHITSPSGSFLFDQTPQKSIQDVSFFSGYPGTVLRGWRKKKHVFYSFTNCLCLFIRSENFANDHLASLLIASCSPSFFISCRLWHFHMLTLCYFWKLQQRGQCRQRIMRLAISSSVNIQTILLMKPSYPLLRSHCRILCHVASL